MIVEENSTLPAPVPDEITTSPPRVTGALISIKPSAVVMLLEIVNAVVSIVKASKAVLPPIAPPRVIVPAPLLRVRLSVPLPSALMVVLKSIFPSSASPPSTSVVIEMAPSITTAPSKSTSASVSPVAEVTISPFKTIEPPSRFISSIVVPVPIPPVPTVKVPLVVRVTSS